MAKAWRLPIQSTAVATTVSSRVFRQGHQLLSYRCSLYAKVDRKRMSSKGDLTLRTICNELKEIRWRVFQFGVQLGIPEYKLKEFVKDDDPLASVITFWLNGNVEDVPVTWSSIQKALRSLGEKKLADQIKEKYCLHEKASIVQESSSQKLMKLSLKDLVLLKILKWFNLGLRLKIEEHDLKKIKMNHHDDVDECSRAMFSQWLSQSDNPDLRELLQALCDIGEHNAARQLAEKFGVACECAERELPRGLSLSLPSGPSPLLPSGPSPSLPSGPSPSLPSGPSPSLPSGPSPSLPSGPSLSLPSGPSPSFPSGPSPSEAVSPSEKYADLLRSYYNDHELFPVDQWPPTLSEFFVNLALIQHEKIPTEDTLTPFEKATLNGTVDEICFRKYNIQLDQILKPDAFFFKKSSDLEEQRKLYEQQLIRCVNFPMPDFLKKKFNIPIDDGKGLPSEQELSNTFKQSSFLAAPQLKKMLLTSQVESGISASTSDSDDLGSLKMLIDGAPGVGKTTLTWKISQEWAQGKLFQQFSLIIRVTLHSLPDEPEGIWELLPLGSEQLKKSVEKELLDRNGRGALLILDGWDELSVEQRKKGSVLYQLMRGDILSQCSVIVTSRPYTSRWLQLPRMVPRHIELFGFTQDQIRLCIQNEFASSPELAQKLIQLLEVRVDIFKFCYIPINLSIIIYIFRTSRYSLPATLTELYQLYVHSAKVNYMQAECEDPEVALSFDETSSFPKDVQDIYVSLCSLALWGLEQDRPRMVFKDKELVDLSPLLGKEGKTLGLMTAYKSFTSFGIQRSFQFIHATIQEFLAADALSEKSLDEQFEFVQNHWDNPQFQLVLSFLAGRTGLASVEGMLHVPLSFKGHPNVSRFLLLVRMLYETQNDQLCHVLAQHCPDNSLQLSSLVDIHNSRISELDFFMLCYFLRHSACAWKALDAFDGPLSLMLDAFKTSPPGLSVRELHIDNSTRDDVYKSLLHPCFRSLEALRIDIETPLGEHAFHYLSLCTLTHLQLDCLNQESVDTSMSAACKCHTLQYLGLKTQRTGRETVNDVQKKLLLSESLALPIALSNDFRLNFEDFVLTDGFTERLCTIVSTSQHIKGIFFQGCILNSHQLNILFAAIHTSTLQTFHLQLAPMKSQWSSEAITTVNSMVERNQTLTSLQLSFCSIGDGMAIGLGQALGNNRSLVSLNLASNGAISSSISYIMAGIQSSSEVAIKESLKPNLHTLILRECGLKDEEMKHVAQFISSACCAINELDLSYNDIKQEGSDALFAAIATNSSLSVLKLDGNPLWLSNGDQLREMLFLNTTLTELHLLCGLHVPAIQELANGLTRNSALQTLRLGIRLPFNRTPKEGACMLFKALKANTALKHFLLSSYILGTPGTEAAAEALKHNSTLVSLHLKGCKLGSVKSVDTLIEALYSHKSLCEIAIPVIQEAFMQIFSHYDRINCQRIAKGLPCLRVIDAQSSFNNSKPLLLP